MNSLNHVNLSSQTVFDVGFWFTFPKHNINLSLHARDWWLLHHWPVIVVSVENFPSWFETLQKSHLIVPISPFQISRKSALKWDFHLYFWWNANCLRNSFPMNTDASNVEDINIPQIIERLSMSCTASSGERFNIFRTRSFTLCKNDLDFNERSDSVAVSMSISSSMTNLSSTGLPRSRVRHFTRFPLLRRPLVVNVPFWVVWWASAQYGSHRTCLLHI